MPASILKIQVGSPNWEKKAIRAVDQKKQFELVVQGPQAQAAGEAIKRSVRTPRGIRPMADPVVTPTVLLTAAVIVGVIAVVGLGVMAAVCLYGISKGYTVYARHIAKGPWPFDDQLIFKLVPPSAS
jgi:hypothetical protein